MEDESGAPEEKGTYSSLYLTAEDMRMVSELREETGMGRSALYRLALQKMYYGDDTHDRRERLIAIAEEIKRLA